MNIIVLFLIRLENVIYSHCYVSEFCIQKNRFYRWSVDKLVEFTMDILLFAVLAVIVLLGIITVVYTLKRGRTQKEPDYRSWFIMGTIFVTVYLVGILTGLYEPIPIFLILGLVFTLTGLANYKKWGQPRRLLTESEKKTRITAITIGLAILLILGAVFFILAEYL
jgi:hypothetical protein